MQAELARHPLIGFRNRQSHSPKGLKSCEGGFMRERHRADVPPLETSSEWDADARDSRANWRERVLLWRAAEPMFSKIKSRSCDNARGNQHGLLVVHESLMEGDIHETKSCR